MKKDMGSVKGLTVSHGGGPLLFWVQMCEMTAILEKFPLRLRSIIEYS
jgi:hypothetical protein